MLALTRRKNESITIILPNGEKVLIRISQIKRNQARIGIEAKKEIKILRTELILTDVKPVG